jgi:hypothetical protein
MVKTRSRKRRSLEGKGIKRPVPKERGVLSVLSERYGFAPAFAIIAVTVLIIYSNTFSSPFHFDDIPNIVENYKLRDLSNFWPPTGSRYVGSLSFAVNYHFGELDVFGYHLVNIVVHILNGFLVWSLVLLTFKTPVFERGVGGQELKYLIALSASVIYIAHPVHPPRPDPGGNIHRPEVRIPCNPILSPQSGPLYKGKALLGSGRARQEPGKGSWDRGDRGQDNTFRPRVCICRRPCDEDKGDKLHPPVCYSPLRVHVFRILPPFF